MNIRTMAVVVSVLGITVSGASVANVASTMDQLKPANTILYTAQTSADAEMQVAISDFAKGAIVGGVVTGVIVNERNKARYRGGPRYYRGSPNSYEDAKRLCAQEYKSYSWRTDTFITYSGVEKLCPYVRPYY